MRAPCDRPRRLTNQGNRRPAARAKPRARGVRVDRQVRRPTHSLKVMVAIRAIEAPLAHTTVLKTGDHNCMGMGRFGQAFRRAPFRSQRARRALREPRTGNRSDAYLWPRNQNWSRCLDLVFMAHLHSWDPTMRGAAAIIARRLRTPN